MANEKVDRFAVAQHQMGLLHLEILEEMTHAVTAIERTADHMI
ncbi:hypothetical protein [Bradyrhizobium japonicum]|nr:hypothetical protein [Bradyrhizobium japonicum]